MRLVFAQHISTFSTPLFALASAIHMVWHNHRTASTMRTMLATSQRRHQPPTHIAIGMTRCYCRHPSRQKDFSFARSDASSQYRASRSLLLSLISRARSDCGATSTTGMGNRAQKFAVPSEKECLSETSSEAWDQPPPKKRRMAANARTIGKVSHSRAWKSSEAFVLPKTSGGKVPVS